ESIRIDQARVEEDGAHFVVRENRLRYSFDRARSRQSIIFVICIKRNIAPDKRRRGYRIRPCSEILRRKQDIRLCHSTLDSLWQDGEVCHRGKHVFVRYRIEKPPEQ